MIPAKVDCKIILTCGSDNHNLLFCRYDGHNGIKAADHACARYSCWPSTILNLVSWPVCLQLKYHRRILQYLQHETRNELTFLARLHMVLAQEPALRTCTGEVGASALPWASHDGMREAQEAADMGNAVRRAFSLVDGEILERAREEEGRDGATALIVLRIGMCSRLKDSGNKGSAILCCNASQHHQCPT